MGRHWPAGRRRAGGQDQRSRPAPPPCGPIPWPAGRHRRSGGIGPFWTDRGYGAVRFVLGQGLLELFLTRSWLRGQILFLRPRPDSVDPHTARYLALPMRRRRRLPSGAQDPAGGPSKSFASRIGFMRRPTLFLRSPLSPKAPSKGRRSHGHIRRIAYGEWSVIGTQRPPAHLSASALFLW